MVAAISTAFYLWLRIDMLLTIQLPQYVQDKIDNHDKLYNEFILLYRKNMLEPRSYKVYFLLLELAADIKSYL